MFKHTGKLAAFFAIASGFREPGPGSYVESLTVIDSALWQESMIVEICQLESMDSWDHCCSFEWLASQSFVKATNGCSSSNIAIMCLTKGKVVWWLQAIRREKAETFLKVSASPVVKLHCDWYLDWLHSCIEMHALLACISFKLAVGEHVYMKMIKGFDTLLDTHCLTLNGCIYGLCQSPRVFLSCSHVKLIAKVL